MTAVSLFSGLGGFELAAEANGIKILCQVEIDERCRKFLHSHWPNIPQYADIKNFPAERYTGATFVLGGPPCQPVSLAGKRRGKEDDRWLWGETLSVIEIIKPRWCLLENPSGLINMGFDGICTTLEALGYEVQAFDIPACAVNSPQIRARVWIVAHATIGQCDTGAESGGEIDSGEHKKLQPTDYADRSGQSHLADTENNRHLRPRPARRGRARFENDIERNSTESDRQGDAAAFGGGGIGGSRTPAFWDNYVYVPCADGKVRRAPDDTQRMAHGLPVELLAELGEEGRQTPEECIPHRSLLGALGNSICWPVAAEIIKAITEVDI